MTSYRWTMHRVYDATGNDTLGPAAISMWWLARAAAEETLQGSPLASAWLKLFRSHLSVDDPYWFRWAEDLAQSAELRRAYSGLYGRFVARALLSAHLGINRFVSLKRNGVVIPGSVAVTRISKGDIPDWIAWDDRASRHVLCEAKGSLTSRDFLAPGVPKCVKEGKAQFDRVETTGASGKLYPARWVAATRWVTDHRGGTPATLLWDPPQDHRPFSEDEAARHREAMTRAWLDSIAPGLGWRDADELLAPDRSRMAIVVNAEPGPVPPSQDWPELPDNDLPLIARLTEVARLDRFVAQRRPVPSDGPQDVADLAGAQSGSQTYQASWLPRPRGPEAKPHQGDYIAALATPFGLRPMRTRADFDLLRRAQDRARDLEEPAMIIGLPVGMDPGAAPAQTTWLDGAGISRKQDLAVFDLRRVKVDLLDSGPTG
ncbi:hypothetical protein [Caulobacter sp. BE254]|uniref:hypothetical protein n=1 Tax=Caulobacter sp. BE254 TaxID=2817720 RepID=UPI002859A3BF|nr:hypothetical protein [Caulobacter sp. BE254]MDR7117380.1 hypothetical protein [Caulobacter sp. BE254]